MDTDTDELEDSLARAQRDYQLFKAKKLKPVGKLFKDDPTTRLRPFRQSILDRAPLRIEFSTPMPNHSRRPSCNVFPSDVSSIGEEQNMDSIENISVKTKKMKDREPNEDFNLKKKNDNLCTDLPSFLKKSISEIRASKKDDNCFKTFCQDFLPEVTKSQDNNATKKTGLNNGSQLMDSDNDEKNETNTRSHNATGYQTRSKIDLSLKKNKEESGQYEKRNVSKKRSKNQTKTNRSKIVLPITKDKNNTIEKSSIKSKRTDHKSRSRIVASLLQEDDSDQEINQNLKAKILKNTSKLASPVQEKSQSTTKNQKSTLQIEATVHDKSQSKASKCKTTIKNKKSSLQVNVDDRGQEDIAIGSNNIKNISLPLQNDEPSNENDKNKTNGKIRLKHVLQLNDIDNDEKYGTNNRSHEATGYKNKSKIVLPLQKNNNDDVADNDNVDNEEIDKHAKRNVSNSILKNTTKTNRSKLVLPISEDETDEESKTIEHKTTSRETLLLRKHDQEQCTYTNISKYKSIADSPFQDKNQSKINSLNNISNTVQPLCGKNDVDPLVETNEKNLLETTGYPTRSKTILQLQEHEEEMNTMQDVNMKLKNRSKMNNSIKDKKQTEASNQKNRSKNVTKNCDDEENKYIEPKTKQVDKNFTSGIVTIEQDKTQTTKGHKRKSNINLSLFEEEQLKNETIGKSPKKFKSTDNKSTSTIVASLQQNDNNDNEINENLKTKISKNAIEDNTNDESGDENNKNVVNSQKNKSRKILPIQSDDEIMIYPNSTKTNTTTTSSKKKSILKRFTEKVSMRSFGVNTTNNPPISRCLEDDFASALEEDRLSEMKNATEISPKMKSFGCCVNEKDFETTLNLKSARLMATVDRINKNLSNRRKSILKSAEKKRDSDFFEKNVMFMEDGNQFITPPVKKDRFLSHSARLARNLTKHDNIDLTFGFPKLLEIDKLFKFNRETNEESVEAKAETSKQQLVKPWRLEDTLPLIVENNLTPMTLESVKKVKSQPLNCYLKLYKNKILDCENDEHELEETLPSFNDLIKPATNDDLNEKEMMMAEELKHTNLSNKEIHNTTSPQIQKSLQRENDNDLKINCTGEANISNKTSKTGRRGSKSNRVLPLSDNNNDRIEEKSLQSEMTHYKTKPEIFSSLREDGSTNKKKQKLKNDSRIISSFQNDGKSVQPENTAFHNINELETVNQQLKNNDNPITLQIHESFQSLDTMETGTQYEEQTNQKIIILSNEIISSKINTINQKISVDLQSQTNSSQVNNDVDIIESNITDNNNVMAHSSKSSPKSKRRKTKSIIPSYISQLNVIEEIEGNRRPRRACGPPSRPLPGVFKFKTEKKVNAVNKNHNVSTAQAHGTINSNKTLETNSRRSSQQSQMTFNPSYDVGDVDNTVEYVNQTNKSDQKFVPLLSSPKLLENERTSEVENNTMAQNNDGRKPKNSKDKTRVASGRVSKKSNNSKAINNSLLNKTIEILDKSNTQHLLNWIGTKSSQNCTGKDPSISICLENQVENTAAGVLTIPAGKTKNTRVTKKFSLYFFVVQGEAQVKLNDRESDIDVQTCFTIPKGFSYSIANKSQVNPLVLNFVRIAAN